MKNKLMNGYITFCIYALIGWIYEVLWLWFVVPPRQFENRGVLFGPFLPIYGFGMLILLFCLKTFMTKKHELQNPLYMGISTSVLTTFFYTSFIEYTTPRIHNILEYLKSYGIGLLIANIIVFVIVYLVVNKTKNEKLKKFDTTIILVFILVWLITTTIEFISHFVIDNYFHKILWDYTKDFLNINGRVTWDASRNFALGGTLLLFGVQPKINNFLNNTKEKNKILITLIIGIPMLLDFIFHTFLKLI